MKKKLLLISLDAMIGKDIEILKTLPTFSPILEKAEVNDTNDEDFHENMEFKRYRADRNPENFNKYYDK